MQPPYGRLYIYICACAFVWRPPPPSVPRDRVIDLLDTRYVGYRYGCYRRSRVRDTTRTPPACHSHPLANTNGTSNFMKRTPSDPYGQPRCRLLARVRLKNLGMGDLTKTVNERSPIGPFFCSTLEGKRETLNYRTDLISSSCTYILSFDK